MNVKELNNANKLVLKYKTEMNLTNEVVTPEQT